MTRYYVVFFAAIILLLNGCGESVVRESHTGGGFYSVFENPAAVSRNPDERFTISLAIYEQEDQRQQAQQLQRRAARALNRDDVWIETIPDGVSVNLGHYKTLAKAKRDLPKIKVVYATIQPGDYQFFYAKEVPEPDPPAPQEWDISSSNCFYSLQIATYYDVPESNYFSRKHDAVQAVKNLRQAGEPAYYYHGYFESLVLIGCIPENVALPIVELFRQKHPWHYENSYRVYHVTQNQNQEKVRVQDKSHIVTIADIVESR